MRQFPSTHLISPFKQTHEDQRGFTLVESTVSIAVLAIVVAAVAAVLVFSSNMTMRQEAVSNAQTLASTVQSSLEAALSSASDISVTEDGSQLTFTSTKNTDYLAKGTYVISVYSGTSTKQGTSDLYLNNGQLSIKEQGSQADNPLLPASTYINGDKLQCTFGTDAITIKVTDANGGELATSTLQLADRGIKVQRESVSSRASVSGSTAENNGASTSTATTSASSGDAA